MSAIATKDIPRISIQDANQKFSSDEKIVFLDTRSDAAWSKSDQKIPGALRIPPDQAEQHLADIARDRTIITYCT